MYILSASNVLIYSVNKMKLNLKKKNLDFMVIRHDTKEKLSFEIIVEASLKSSWYYKYYIIMNWILKCLFYQMHL